MRPLGSGTDNGNSTYASDRVCSGVVIAMSDTAAITIAVTAAICVLGALILCAYCYRWRQRDVAFKPIPQDEDPVQIIRHASLTPRRTAPELSSATPAPGHHRNGSSAGQRVVEFGVSPWATENEIDETRGDRSRRYDDDDDDDDQSDDDPVQQRQRSQDLALLLASTRPKTTSTPEQQQASSGTNGGGDSAASPATLARYKLAPLPTPTKGGGVPPLQSDPLEALLPGALSAGDTAAALAIPPSELDAATVPLLDTPRPSTTSPGGASGGASAVVGTGGRQYRESEL